MQCKHPKRYKKILCARCVHFVCNDCMIRYDGHAFCSHACIAHYNNGHETPVHRASTEMYSEPASGNSSTFASRIFSLIDYTSEHPTALSTNIMRGGIGVAATAFMALYVFTGSGDTSYSNAPSAAAVTAHASIDKDTAPHDVIKAAAEPLPSMTVLAEDEALFPPEDIQAGELRVGELQPKELHIAELQPEELQVVEPQVVTDSEPVFASVSANIETTTKEVIESLEGTILDTPAALLKEETPAEETLTEERLSAPPITAASVVSEEIFTKETTVIPGHMDRASLEEKPVIKKISPLFLPGQSIELFDMDSGITSEMKIAVTFDGGSNGNHAGEILDALAERGIKTTFFLAGQFIKLFPHTVKRIVADGHEVANHTRNHPHLTSYETDFRHNTLPGVTREFLLKELREADLIFTAITGKKMSHYWRAPYGEVNVQLIEWAADEGYIHVGWTTDHDRRKSLDTLDWVSDEESELYLNTEEIKDRILSYDDSGDGLRGGIILMHLGSRRTTDRLSSALGDLIDSVTARGYEFVKVSELFEKKRNALRKKAAEEETLALKNAPREANLDL